MPPLLEGLLLPRVELLVDLSLLKLSGVTAGILLGVQDEDDDVEEDEANARLALLMPLAVTSLERRGAVEGAAPCCCCCSCCCSNGVGGG